MSIPKDALRALVDANNKLVINWATDYANGVDINGDVSIGGTLRAKGDILMGNPARKVAIQWLFASAFFQFIDVDLGFPRQFTAFGSLVMVNSLVDFDYDNGVYVDIFSVDGSPTSSWLSGPGNNNFGPPGDIRNVRNPSFSGVGQIITFRIWALGPDVEAAALAIVFFE